MFAPRVIVSRYRPRSARRKRYALPQVIAAIAAAEAPDSASVAGRVSWAAVLAASEASDAAAFAGGVAYPVITGVLSGHESPDIVFFSSSVLATIAASEAPDAARFLSPVAGALAAQESYDSFSMVGSPAPSNITATQSYSQVIRDTLFAKTVQLPFFSGSSWTRRRSKQLPFQEYHLPYLGVYIISEDMPPDGDLNAGDIRFINDLKIGWQVIIENNDPVAAELKLDAAFWAIMNGIWRDAKLTNFWQSDLPDDVFIEGVARGTRSHNWGLINKEQTPIGELQYIATVRYRSMFDPVITDELLRIHEEIVPIADNYAEGIPPATEVQRIIVEYEFNPTKEIKRHGRTGRGRQRIR